MPKKNIVLCELFNIQLGIDAIPRDGEEWSDQEAEMALCSRKCPNCNNLVTVRIDYNDSSCGCGKLKEQIGRQVVLDLYNRIAEDFSTEDDGVAIILHVSGADIAARCSHMNRNNENAIELF